MRRFFILSTVVMIAALFLPLTPSEAQFATPVIDGTISSNEYGVHTDGQNQQSTGTGQNWYMTWDSPKPR